MDLELSNFIKRIKNIYFNIGMKHKQKREGEKYCKISFLTDHVQNLFELIFLKIKQLKGYTFCFKWYYLNFDDWL